MKLNLIEKTMNEYPSSSKSFEKSGFYLITLKQDAVEDMQDIYWVDKNINFYTVIAPWNTIRAAMALQKEDELAEALKDTENQPLEIIPHKEEENKVTESFALKMLAITLNKEKIQDIE